MERFAGLGIFRRASYDNGMRSARLLQPVRSDDDLLVLAEWPSADAYQGWLANPARDQINAQLAEFVEGDMTTEIFTVAHAFD